MPHCKLFVTEEEQLLVEKMQTKAGAVRLVVTQHDADEIQLPFLYAIDQVHGHSPALSPCRSLTINVKPRNFTACVLPPVAHNTARERERGKVPILFL